ncbi:MAG: right-handed parallel beta-helix repeat-containing protein, partial [Armatimonadetes bacterium]|nr:right-handed parallel beta-helix repeat-containing protein [Armatimonadota bacterium]
AFTGLGNSPLNVTAAQGVLINDPAPAPVTQFQNPSAQGGTVNINADGSLAYTPPAGFVGQDTFTYTIANQSGQSQATVTVTINNLAFYVNNAGANGNGTFGAPFNNLAAALAAAGPGNIIFVFRGDGTNNGLAGPIVLQDGQVLIGEGAGLNFNNGINPRADVLAQQIVPPDGFPVITGPITLADGNTVSGVRLENTAGDAIAGNGVNGARITDNEIASPTDDGIDLANANGTLTLSNNTVTGAGDVGFDIAFDSVNATLVVQDNQITGPGSEGIRLVPTGAAEVTASVLDNAVSDTGQLGAAFRGAGIQLSPAGTADVTATIASNTVTNSGVGGAGIELLPVGNSVLDLTLTGNQIDDAQSAGIALINLDKAQFTASILNNSSTGAALQ